MTFRTFFFCSTAFTLFLLNRQITATDIQIDLAEKNKNDTTGAFSRGLTEGEDIQSLFDLQKESNRKYPSSDGRPILISPPPSDDPPTDNRQTGSISRGRVLDGGDASTERNSNVPSRRSSDLPESSGDSEMKEAGMAGFRAANKFRTSEGLKAFEWNQDLYDVCLKHAFDMSARGEADYAGYRTRYENLPFIIKDKNEHVGFVGDSSDPGVTAINEWLRREKRLRNYVADYDISAVAVVKSVKGGYYVCENFAKLAPAEELPNKTQDGEASSEGSNPQSAMATFPSLLVLTL